MQTDRVHCVVVRVPAQVPAYATANVAAARHDEELLPWADPYILGLIEKLKREAEADRAAGRKVEFDDACFDFDMEIEELLADACGMSSVDGIAAVETEETIALVRLPR
jgi:hypothetical protein